MPIEIRHSAFPPTQFDGVTPVATRTPHLIKSAAGRREKGAGEAGGGGERDGKPGRSVMPFETRRVH